MRELRAHRDRIAGMALGEPNDDPVEAGSLADPTELSISCPSQAVQLARHTLPLIVIPDSAIESIEELDITPESPAWGRWPSRQTPRSRRRP